MGGNLERFVKCKYGSFTVGLILTPEEATGSKITSKPQASKAKRSAVRKEVNDPPLWKDSVKGEFMLSYLGSNNLSGKI